MATDPVCGMQVAETPDALRLEVRGRTYYFCAESCLEQFRRPEEELAKTRLLAAFAIASGAVLMALPMLAHEALMEPWMGWVLLALGTAVQVVAGRPFYLGIGHAIAARAANMDTLIAMGTTAAWLFSAIEVAQPELLVAGVQHYYFEIGALVLGFILAGRWLEHLMRRRASDAVRKLLELQPTTARLLRDGEEVEVPIGEVFPDDLLVVRPGDRIPVDAVVVEGRSAVDEKLLTGESLPVDKQPGSEVIGGTVNQQGRLVLRAAKVGMDTALSQIVRLVEEAQTARAPVQRLVDVVSAYFVPAVVLVAAGSLVAWSLLAEPLRGFLALVAVLLIACPCALGLATPAALVVGVSKGAERGILIKGGEPLERVRKVDAVVFDKTGTLTRGEPALTDVVALRGSEAEVLALAAAAERGSEHPLGEAIVRGAKARGVQVPEAADFEAIAGGGVRATVREVGQGPHRADAAAQGPRRADAAGQGPRGADATGRGTVEVLVGNVRLLRERGVRVEAAEAAVAKLQEQGKTAMLVARAGEVVGVLAVADQVKPEARPAVAALQAMGIEVVMITGDNPRTAAAVAREVGIARVLAEVRPADKAAQVQALQGEGRVVAMVGDGVNDAPALAQADVGIAIGSGSDVAVEAGDLVLMRSDPRDVAASIQLGRRTMSKIRQNLFWAFFYNVALIPIAASGFLNPVLAGAAMALSSVTVVGNALLLRRFRAVV